MAIRRRFAPSREGEWPSVTSEAEEAVIDAGPNGLVAADLPADAGWDVTDRVRRR